MASAKTAAVSTGAKVPPNIKGQEAPKKKKKKGKLILILFLILLVAGCVCIYIFNLFGMQDVVLDAIIRSDPKYAQAMAEVEQASADNETKSAELETLSAELDSKSTRLDKRSSELDTREKDLADQQTMILTQQQEFESGRLSFEQLVTMYESMSSTEAASIFNAMNNATSTALILSSMDVKKAGAVLSALQGIDSAKAASVARIMLQNTT